MRLAVYFVLPESIKRSSAQAVSSGRSRLGQILAFHTGTAVWADQFGYFLLITAFSIMTTAFVLFTAFRFGYNAEQNGYLFAFVGVVAIIGQGVLFHKLANRFGEAVLAAVGCFAMVLQLFGLPFIGPSQSGGLTLPWVGHLSTGLMLLLLFCILTAIGNSLASPALTSLASKVSHEHEQGKSLGIHAIERQPRTGYRADNGGFLLNNSVSAVDNSTIARTFWTAISDHAGCHRRCGLFFEIYAKPGRDDEI